MNQVTKWLTDWADVLLSEHQWYRKWTGSEWIYIRIDLGDRPMFWTRSTKDFHASHTVLETEQW